MYAIASSSISPGQLLEEVRTAERIDDIDDTGLVRDDLLRPQRQRGRGLGRQRQRFVERVGVERLRAAKHRCHRLERRPHHVVVRLLRGQRHASRLCMEAQLPRARRSRLEPIAHHPRPDPARGAKLGDLLEEVAVRVEEEGDPRREHVDIEPGVDAYSTYSMPSRSVNASSCAAVAPASRM